MFPWVSPLLIGSDPFNYVYVHVHVAVDFLMVTLNISTTSSIATFCMIIVFLIIIVCKINNQVISLYQT